MPHYRRARLHGGTFFFTVVTYLRRPIFGDAAARKMLGNSFRECLARQPFQLDAIVLLPDHLHSIWSLPPGDADFSGRWSRIKREFTRAWLAFGGEEVKPSAGKCRDRRRGVWQPRFWEHTIEEDNDYDRHFDYLHYNPKKHGLVERVSDWPHSSFHRWVRAGVYPSGWGGGSVAASIADMEHSTGEP
ncbi:MAG: transposase [Planctomycetaceae bacterium]|nr:transposase [Planctomycetaceae bacterium]